MRNTGRKGQALVELAVFGSLLLMLLGYVINNALNYDYQQQATTEAFRRSLATSAGSSLDKAPVSTSYLLIQDRHIPDPSDPFGVGSIVPITASAGVTRKYNLQNVPLTEESLPRLAIQIGNVPTHSYTIAGFRDEYNVLSSSLERYRYVYGSHNGFVCDKPECGGGESCPKWGAPEENPETGSPEPVCLEWRKHVRIVDSCAGEIMDRENCLSQVAQIVDSSACQRACEKTGQSNCAQMCSQPMDQPEYAKVGVPENIGLLPGSVQTITKNNRLTTTETSSGIRSASEVSVTEKTERTVVRTDGSTDTITTERPPETANTSTTWSTSW